MQFRDLKKQYQVLKKPMDEAISKVLEASNYISGAQVAELEEKLASIERQITANATNSVKLRELMEKQENCATELEEKERLYVRVLPSKEALDLCEKAQIPHSHILALQGPFTTALNIALMEQYHIGILVTKDGGKKGGFLEKQEAARLQYSKSVRAGGQFR